VVYVNTVTTPLWLVVLNAPLLLARSVVVNSWAARTTLLRAVPALRSRTEVVHNGVAGPPDGALPFPIPGGGAGRLALVGRLSPRKGTDVALEALALLRAQGHDADLHLYGSVFPGYEWYEAQLRDRASDADVAGHVHFAGYTSPPWPALADAQVVLVPSRTEPFGNAAVEAQLAGRPVVASDVQGLREIVTDGETGVLAPPGDASALAAAVAGLLDDPARAATLAGAGRASALRQFTTGRYRAAIVEVADRTRTRPVRVGTGRRRGQD
jgi:glycosyltransferase involved in cell wall biosynthesis